MRKLIMWNLVTLDGFFEGPKSWDIDWHDTIWGRARKVCDRAIEVNRDAVVRPRNVRRNGRVLALPERRGRRFHEHDPENRLFEDVEEGRVEQHAAGESEARGRGRQTQTAARQGSVCLWQREPLGDALNPRSV